MDTGKAPVGQHITALGGSGHLLPCSKHQQLQDMPAQGKRGGKAAGCVRRLSELVHAGEACMKVLVLLLPCRQGCDCNCMLNLYVSFAAVLQAGTLCKCIRYVSCVSSRRLQELTACQVVHCCCVVLCLLCWQAHQLLWSCLCCC